MNKLMATTMIGLTLLIAACSGGSASRTEAFYRAIDQGQISEGIALTDPALVQKIGEARSREELSKVAERYRANGGFKDLSVNGDEHGEIANYEVTITFGNGKVWKEKAKLLKIQGTWYLTPP